MERITTISLRDGSTLQLSMKNEFLIRVANHYGLKDIQDIHEQHIKTYIYDVLKSAVDKVDDGPPRRDTTRIHPDDLV